MDEEEKTRRLQSLNQETEFFTSIIDSIPPEHYGYDEEVRNALKERKHTLIDEKLSQAQRSTLSNKSKTRLARLDDRQCRTNSQIFAYLNEMKKSEKGNKRQKKDGETNKGDQGSKSPKGRRSLSKMKKAMANGDAGGPISVDRQQLLNKLQTKLDEMRANRNATSQGGVDYEEKKRLKRRMSKVKLKERRRHDKDNPINTVAGDDQKFSNQSDQKSQPSPSKKLANGHGAATNPRSPSIPNPMSGLAKKRHIQDQPSTPQPKKPAVMDKDGRMVFSKFDFAVPGVVDDDRKDKWAKKHSGKDYKRLLEKQERFEGKLQRLEDKDDGEGAKKLKEKSQWDAATQRARGEKVKDDKSLLKKNLKRKEKRKDQIKQKWDSRKEGVQKKMDDRQKKRTENIQAKKKDNKDKKLTKARKKGRLV
jgi:hypothetical protein